MYGQGACNDEAEIFIFAARGLKTYVFDFCSPLGANIKQSGFLSARPSAIQFFCFLFEENRLINKKVIEELTLVILAFQSASYRSQFVNA